VGKVTFKICEPFRAEKKSRNKEKCGHTESTQVPHSEVRVREILLNVEQANEQKNESLEFVNPTDSRLPVVAHNKGP
jgi:hypothetical protein